MRRTGPEKERFLGKINATSGSSDCWEWRGAPISSGYGQFVPNRTVSGQRAKPILAHRYSYELFVAPIPEGLYIDHLCRNKMCVNPAHLEPVTQAENVRRGVSIHAHNSRKTHCKWGHEFTPENVIQVTAKSGNPGRLCRECHTLRGRNIHPAQLERRNAA